jgi:hypothetical protein
MCGSRTDKTGSGADLMSKRRTMNARVVVAYIGLVHIPVTVLTWRDLSTRPAAQIRGSKSIWRLASALNTTGSVAYWLFGLRRSALHGSDAT